MAAGRDLARGTAHGIRVKIMEPGPGSATDSQSLHESRIRQSLVAFGGGELLGRIIAFAATVVVARQLGAEAYGVIGFAFALMLYAQSAAELGLEQLGPREVADRDAGLDTLVSSLLLTRLAISVLLAALMSAAGLLLVTKPEGSVLAIFSISLLAVGANARWVHLGLDQAGVVSAARILAELVKAALVVAFVRGPEDLFIFPIAHVACELFGSGILLAALHRRGIRLRWQVDTSLARRVFRDARPLLLTSLLSLLIYNADVIVLRLFRDRAEVGLYLVAYTLLNFIGVLGNVITLSLLPTLRRLRNAPEQASAIYHSTMAQAFAAGLPVAVGATLLAPGILALVFGSEYTASAAPLRILIWSFPLLLLRSVEAGALIAQGRQHQVLILTGVAAAVNLSLNFAVIPFLGMVGAAATTVLAELIRFGLARRFVHTGGMDAVPWRRLGQPVFAAGAMAVVLLGFGPMAVIAAVPLGAIIYVVGLSITGGVIWSGGRPSLRL